jgi:hypothetical protein
MQKLSRNKANSCFVRELAKSNRREPKRHLPWKFGQMRKESVCILLCVFLLRSQKCR